MHTLTSIRALLDQESIRNLIPHFTPREEHVNHFWSHLSVREVINEVAEPFQALVKRINVTIYSNSSAALNQSVKLDPFVNAGQYSLAWSYFCVVILAAALVIHMYHLWTDKIRRALHKEGAMGIVGKSSNTSSPDDDYEMHNLGTANSTNMLFPREQAPVHPTHDVESSLSIPIVNKFLALVRYVVYRPVPSIRYGKKELPFPSLSVIVLTTAAFLLVILYSFIPQPLYYASIAFGSPPLAIRAGMFSVATIPWIIAISMKANFVSLITGVGHERLNVLHRWLGYICLVLALIHMIPFYITPVWTQGALQVYQAQGYFWGFSYPYTTGLAAFAALALLCVHSLPFVRSKMYELFVTTHAPLSVVFLGMMFWHCSNYLSSWSYLWATVGIWVASLLFRPFYLNWAYFWRPSWLCGEESAITLLPENAVKITIPSQMKWKPGQFVYLRMPGISFFENHPFTIASLYSDDFPSEYGEQYRDMVLVFRPFGGFTRKVVETAQRNGPYHTYRAFIDGPYGGMQRELTSFDTAVLIAGGSGITAIISHLLLLIKKMRDGTAVTKQVHVIWALKRPETAEWFREELRICRQFAPPESVHCQFFITAAKRNNPQNKPNNPPSSHHHLGSRPSSHIHDRVNDAFQGIASKRNSAIIRDEAEGDPEREKELHAENEDEIRALPQAYLSPTSATHPSTSDKHAAIKSGKRRPPSMKIEIPSESQTASFDFGFPSTPTVLQKSLMRFAFMPGVSTRRGWHTEYGRPDIPFMLKGLRREFGKRTCIFVCGPPSMRVDVQRCVAGMQSSVWSDPNVDEIFMHTENYAI
jgi:predicted ferric reductase